MVFRIIVAVNLSVDLTVKVIVTVNYKYIPSTL
jgi:hypothetical protein